MTRSCQNNSWNFIIGLEQYRIDFMQVFWFNLFTHKFDVVLDARYEFPELEKRVRGIIVDVQQRARHLTPQARNFLELVRNPTLLVYYPYF